MKTYLSFNEILKVAFVPKLLNISLKNEISFVVLRISKKRTSNEVLFVYSALKVEIVIFT